MLLFVVQLGYFHGWVLNIVPGNRDGEDIEETVEEFLITHRADLSQETFHIAP